MMISSLKPKADLFIFPPQLIPLNPTFENFVHLFTQTDFPRNLCNSMFVATCFTLLSVFLCSLGGYTFAKLHFPGRNILFMIVIATMTLPFEITLVPLFIQMTHMHWLNTYQAVIIPFAARAWGIFLMRQALNDIPEDLLDAARIDGASEFKIFYRVVVPVSKPAIMALAILMFLNSWNDYMWPLIVLGENKMMTLPVALAVYKSAYYVDYSSLTAGSFLSVIPMFILFLALQKYFVQGALFGSIKG
jgi:ABC-type glycerol-3-phosphate transport system permease component